jgi:formylglycine-generating enzyme required for sulfatase activity
VDHLPVEQVSWFDAVTYCNRRSVKEKLKPCYTVVTNPDTEEFGKWTVSCDFTAPGYRLPSESEWEFAARGGIRTRGFKFPGSWRAEDVAWFDTNALSSTHPVARKATNELGLYDMAGNVWEWVWDWYAPYVEGYVKNPYGPYIGRVQPDSQDSPVARTRRGGAWIDDEAPGDLGVRLTRRSPMEPDASDDTTGFRVVRTK